MLRLCISVIYWVVLRPWWALGGLFGRNIGRRAPAVRKDSPPAGSYTVTVIDNFHRGDPDEAFKVSGFATRAMAETYAVRRVRSSIEQFRKEAADATDLRHRWNTLGEEVVVEGRYIGLSRFDEFAADPATGEDCDYLALQPSQRP